MKYAVAAAAFLLFAACPHKHEDFSQTGPTKTSTSTTLTKASPLDPRTPPRSSGTPTVPNPANQTVNVELTEYSIQIPQTLNAGTYTFNIVNAGHEDHSFVIEGPNAHFALRDALKRGDSTSLAVKLERGSYSVYCPVDKHKEKGMSSTLTVQ